MTDSKRPDLDLTPFIDPKPSRTLRIPLALVQPLFAEFSSPPKRAALQRAYRATLPKPWPGGVDLKAFDAASETCRLRLEARFVELSAQRLLDDKTVPAELKGTLTSALTSAAGRIIEGHPELLPVKLITPADAEALAEELGDFILEMQLPDVPRPSGSPIAPSAESDRAAFDLAEWWSGLRDPSPPQRPRPLDAPASWGRIATEADLGGILSRRAKDDSVLAGFAPIVERRTGDATRLEILPEKKLYLHRELRCRHMLICGKTGVGKTQGWILPMLRSDLQDPTRTVVVIDAKGELYAPVAELTERYRPGTEVEVINFVEPEYSQGWNPLAGALGEDEANSIAFALCHASERDGGVHDSPFWINNSIELIGGLILALKREKGCDVALADLLQAVSMSPKQLSEIAARHPDIAGLRCFAHFISTGSHNAATAASDARTRLGILRNERIAAVTSKDEFHVRGLGDRPRVVLLQIHEEDADYLAPITTIFLTQLLDGLVTDARSAPGRKLPHHVALFVEEFASAMGQIPKMAGRLNTLRSRNVSFAASVQGLSQIHSLYRSEAAALLLGFSSQVFFSGVDVPDAEWVSRAAGQGLFFEETFTDFFDTDPGPFADPPRSSRSRRAALGPLFLPGEITSPPYHELFGGAATFLLADTPPFQAFLTPSYLLRDLGAMLRDAERRAAHPPLRKEPLTWPPESGPRKPVRRLSDTVRMSIAQLEERREEVLVQLGMPQAPAATQLWWKETAYARRGQQSKLLHFLEEAWCRSASLEQLHEAHVVASGLSDACVLLYLDFILARHKEQGHRPTSQDPFSGLRLEKSSRKLLDTLLASSKPPATDEEVQPDSPRAQEMAYWLDRKAKEGWTLAATARASGISTRTLRRWARRLGK